MRWATVFALFLLAGIPSCSSDGSQLASLFSTTDTPTSVFMNPRIIDNASPPSIDESPDDVALPTTHSDTVDKTLDETLISKRNGAIDSSSLANGTRDGAFPSTLNLTAPIDSANSEGSSSLAEETSSITSSERVMEKDASTSSDGAFYDDSYRYEDEDPADTGDGGLSSNENPKAEALMGSQENSESPPGSTTNSTVLDGLSSTELKTRLDEAETRLNLTRAEKDKAEKEWKMKQQEAIAPNREYEEKKEKWDKLVKIADEKGKAEAEYKTANSAFKSLSKKFTRAETAFTTKKGEVDAAIAVQEEIPLWPGQLQDATNQYNQKSTTKGPLNVEETTWSEAISKAEGDLDSKKDEEKLVIDGYNDANCDDPTQTSTDLCKGYRKDKEDLGREITQIQQNHATAVLEHNKTLAKIGELEKELKDLNAKIGKLTIDISTKTVEIAAENIRKLKEELEPIQREFDAAKQQVEAAKADLDVKKAAKEAAEQTDGGSSVQTAKRAATQAKALMGEARRAKLKANEQVKECKTKLDNASEAVKNAEFEVKELRDRYDVAMTKEKEDQSGSAPIEIIIPVIILVLIVIGGAVGFVIYRRLKNKKPPVAQSNTTVAHTPSGSHQQSAQQQQTPQMVTLPATPATGSPNRAAPTQVPPKNSGTGELPDLATVPFIPGEEPFKIPAKNFKWKGPMRRRTRWHGEPTHDFEGQTGVTHADKIWFDPNANFATEIGQNEIIEDGGPPSDSNRSEWLNNLDEWEKGHKAMMAAQAANKQGPSTEQQTVTSVARSGTKGESKGNSSKGSRKALLPRSEKEKKNKKWRK